MSRKRIGERLSLMVPLSGHDIEEILSEQSANGKRFGDIAQALGLCGPEDVVRAWCDQLAEEPQRVDLEDFGVDGQAIQHIPASLAVQYHIVPVRATSDELVVAVDEALYPQVAKELLGILHEKVKFVLCNHRQIAQAIRTYYPRCSAA